MRVRKISLALLFFLFTANHPVFAGLTTITLAKNAGIRGDEILLNDIAHIENGDPGRLRKLESLVVGRSPLPGKSRNIDSKHIAMRLRQNDFDLSKIRLGENRKTVVTRDSAVISKEKIEKCVKDFIYENMPWDRERVNIKQVRVAKDEVLPAGNVTCKAGVPKNARFLGSFPVAVSFHIDGKFEKKVWTNARIEVMADIVVAARPIARFKPVSEKDVCLRRMDISSLPSGAVMNINDAVGKRTKRKIGVNSVLRADMLEIPPLVRRGDLVTVIAESENFRITTLGEAREKGGRGDKIRVVNMSSKKELFARILDSKTVMVNF